MRKITASPRPQRTAHHLGKSQSQNHKTAQNACFEPTGGLLAEGFESGIVTRAMAVSRAKASNESTRKKLAPGKGNTVKTWLPPQLYAASKRQLRHWTPRRRDRLELETGKARRVAMTCKPGDLPPLPLLHRESGVALARRIFRS